MLLFVGEPCLVLPNIDYGTSVQAYIGAGMGEFAAVAEIARSRTCKLIAEGFHPKMVFIGIELGRNQLILWCGVMVVGESRGPNVDLIEEINVAYVNITQAPHHAAYPSSFPFLVLCLPAVITRFSESKTYPYALCSLCSPYHAFLRSGARGHTTAGKHSPPNLRRPDLTSVHSY